MSACVIIYLQHLSFHTYSTCIPPPLRASVSQNALRAAMFILQGFLGCQSERRIKGKRGGGSLLLLQLSPAIFFSYLSQLPSDKTGLEKMFAHSLYWNKCELTCCLHRQVPCVRRRCRCDRRCDRHRCPSARHSARSRPSSQSVSLTAAAQKDDKKRKK